MQGVVSKYIGLHIRLIVRARRCGSRELVGTKQTGIVRSTLLMEALDGRLNREAKGRNGTRILAGRGALSSLRPGRSRSCRATPKHNPS